MNPYCSLLPFYFFSLFLEEEACSIWKRPIPILNETLTSTKITTRTIKK